MMDWMTWDSTKDGKPKPQPKFCKKCGEGLVPDDSITEYDEYTGKPKQPFLNRMRCPDWRCRFDCEW